MPSAATRPAGTKVTGGSEREQAEALQTGLFQDALRPGETRWYAVDVPEGRRLLASVSAIPSYDDVGQSALRTELQEPDRVRASTAIARSSTAAAAGEGGRVRAQSLLMPDFAGAAELPPGRYTFSVEIEDGLDTDAVPVEIGVQLLEPGEAPGLHARRARWPGAPRPPRRPSRTARAGISPSPPRAGRRARRRRHRRARASRSASFAALVLTRRRAA